MTSAPPHLAVSGWWVDAWVVSVVRFGVWVRSSVNTSGDGGERISRAKFHELAKKIKATVRA